MSFLEDLIGTHWGGHRITKNTVQIYKCTSADRDSIVMVNIEDPADVAHLSDRALHRTFYPAERIQSNSNVPTWLISSWAVRMQTPLAVDLNSV